MALFHVALLFSLLVVYSHGRLYEKLFVMNFENKGFNTVASNYKWKALIDQSFLLPNYYAITHPSQPNYVAQIAGDYFNCTSDSNCNLPYETIVDRLEEKGFTWKAYMESYKYSGNETCYMSNSSPYVRHHNPFMSFTTITSTSRCKNIVDEEKFQDDVRGDTLPTFGFYSPNVYNDSHDRDLYFSGLYLQNFLKTWYFPYLKTTWKDTLFMVTWDEDAKDENNHVVTFFKHPCLSAGVAQVGEVNYTHYSILKFLENNFGLDSLGRNDVNAPDLAKALPCSELVIELKCPASIQVQLDEGQVSAVVNYNNPILRYGDNEQAVVSGTISQYSSKQSAFFSAAANNNNGNSNKNNGNSNSNSGTSVYDDGADYVEPEVVSEVSVQRTTGLSSGSEFPMGETTVVFKASDDFGRSCQCSFSVLIESAQNEAEDTIVGVDTETDGKKDSKTDTQQQTDSTQRGDRFAATSTTIKAQSTAESTTTTTTTTTATTTVAETTESETDNEQQPSLGNESEGDQQPSVKSQPNTITTTAETNESEGEDSQTEEENHENAAISTVSLDPDNSFAATSVKTTSTATEATIEIGTDMETDFDNDFELSRGESDAPTTTKSQPSTSVTPAEASDAEIDAEIADIDAGGESESLGQQIAATKVKATSHATAATSFSTIEDEDSDKEVEPSTEATAPTETNQPGSASTKSTAAETPSVDSETDAETATETPEQADPSTASTKSQPASSQTQVETNNENTPSNEDTEPVSSGETDETQTQQQSTVGIKSTTTTTIKATATNEATDTETEGENKETSTEESQTPNGNALSTNEDSAEVTNQTPEYVSSASVGVESSSTASTTNASDSANTTTSSSSEHGSSALQQGDSLVSTPPVVSARENSVTYVVIAVVFSLSFLIMLTVSIWAYKRRQREGTKGEKAHLYSPLQGSKQKEENFYYGV